MVLFSKNAYQLVKQITWDDVIKKMENEFELETCVSYVNPTSAPTIILHNENQPKSIFDAVKEIEKDWVANSCHVYTSFAKSALTFGRHNDKVNVLIVGAIGTVSYKFDDGSTYLVEPGDSLYISAGEYHDPIVHSARATLSISTPSSPPPQI
jgi:mannose-6-phosphate isomerase-like protein (cupin superfamily)